MEFRGRLLDFGPRLKAELHCYSWRDSFSLARATAQKLFNHSQRLARIHSLTFDDTNFGDLSRFG